MNGAGRARDERAFLAVEAMLDHLHPREDNAARMCALKRHFASADALFRADMHMLEELGVHSNDALLLNRLPELSRLTRRVDLEKNPLMGRLCDASEYLISCFQGLHVERFLLFCLDARGRLKAQVILHDGIADTALFDLRKMLTEAIRTRADAVLISHNHPGLTLRPSTYDVDCTRTAISALTAVGIPLLDHVIVVERQLVSLRQYGYISADAWLNQNPDHRLLRGWLDGADSLDK